MQVLWERVPSKIYCVILIYMHLSKRNIIDDIILKYRIMYDIFECRLSNTTPFFDLISFFCRLIIRMPFKVQRIMTQMSSAWCWNFYLQNWVIKMGCLCRDSYSSSMETASGYGKSPQYTHKMSIFID